MNTLERLKELQANATPGPWENGIAEYAPDDTYQAVGPYHDLEDSGRSSDDKYNSAWADQEFINQSRNMMPDLLEVVEAAEDVRKYVTILHPAIENLCAALAR